MIKSGLWSWMAWARVLTPLFCSCDVGGKSTSTPVSLYHVKIKVIVVPMLQGCYEDEIKIIHHLTLFIQGFYIVNSPPLAKVYL